LLWSMLRGTATRKYHLGCISGLTYRERFIKPAASEEEVLTNNPLPIYESEFRSTNAIL